jgi:hypothetical protein
MKIFEKRLFSSQLHRFFLRDLLGLKSHSLYDVCIDDFNPFVSDGHENLKNFGIKNKGHIIDAEKLE